ncbi:cytochrome P450 83B1-like [Gossypium australe]|uniref:Cytochrome P450 83B1-like n=1 Tax=Gossypium australe TaxID=47621 RepID=A0A5B6WK04_9ROSI|nr:cytochrome P450 83B1-like [Gossypium australe]
MAEEVMKTHDLDFCSRLNLCAARKLSYNASDLSFSPYNHYWREMRKSAKVSTYPRLHALLRKYANSPLILSLST